MTKLFLHIGYPKTGTTSLQRFMWRNRALLRKRGILYPETGSFSATHYNFHKCLGYGDEKANLKPESKETLLESLRREIQAASCQSVVMSSEYFVRVPPQLLRELFDGFDVRIVVYLRRHDLLLDTLYIQRYKSGNLRKFISMEKYIRGLSAPDSAFPLDFLKTIDEFARVFGQDKMIVRPFERGQNTPDLYQDFARAIGFEWNDAFKMPPREANPTVSNEILHAMDAVQLSTASDDLKRKATVSLVKLNNATADVAKTTRITYEQRMHLLERFAPTYRVIASKYLGRDGELFFDPLPKPDDKGAIPKDVSREEIVGLLLRALEPDISGQGQEAA